MYIRTKDGRIIDTSKIATGSKYMDFATNDESFRKIFKTEPLSKSENLDELCDNYVIPRYQDTFIVDRFSKQICLNHIKCGYGDVFGAIWTDKGLIYVAKMNNEGKLELI